MWPDLARSGQIWDVWENFFFQKKKKNFQIWPDLGGPDLEIWPDLAASVSRLSFLLINCWSSVASVLCYHSFVQSPLYSFVFFCIDNHFRPTWYKDRYSIPPEAFFFLYYGRNSCRLVFFFFKRNPPTPSVPNFAFKTFKTF